MAHRIEKVTPDTIHPDQAGLLKEDHPLFDWIHYSALQAL